MSDVFRDVAMFHRKFGLPNDEDLTTEPQLLDRDLFVFRMGFLIEELSEFAEAHGYPSLACRLEELKKGLADELDAGPLGSDLAAAGDALIDLIYVAIGTMHFMGLPGRIMWGNVQIANIAKERATGVDDPRSKRQHRFDVVKPPGWRPPDHAPAIHARKQLVRAHRRTDDGDGA